MALDAHPQLPKYLPTLVQAWIRALINADFIASVGVEVCVHKQCQSHNDIQPPAMLENQTHPNRFIA
jgi:hypothetical protein